MIRSTFFLLALFGANCTWAARTLSVQQVFYLSGATTAADLTVLNTSPFPQTVCVAGETFVRTATAIQSASPDKCLLSILQMQNPGATTTTIAGQNNCVLLSPAAATNWHVTQGATNPNECNIEAGIFEASVYVHENRGSVSGSMFIQQSSATRAIQAFSMVNSGRSF